MGKKEKDQGYNVNVLMSSKIRVDNAVGIFTADSSGKPLTVKKSGNGAHHFSVGAVYLRQEYINNCAILNIEVLLQ